MAIGSGFLVVVRASRPHDPTGFESVGWTERVRRIRRSHSFRPSEHNEDTTPLSFRPSERSERAEESMKKSEKPKQTDPHLKPAQNQEAPK